MAEKLQEFDFKARAGRPDKYPWDEWLDGSVWKLTKADDFPGVKAETMRTAAQAAAQKRDLKVRTSVQDEGEAVIVQSYAPEPAEATAGSKAK